MPFPTGRTLAGAVAARRTGRALGYLVTGMITGVVGFLWSLVSTLAIALTSITQLGGPAFLGATWVTRRLAAIERHRAGWLLGAAIGSPYLASEGGSVLRQVRELVAQPATWRDLAWLVVLLPVGVAAGLAGIVVTTVNLGVALAPAWAWAVPNPNAPFLIKPALTTTPGRFVLCFLGIAVLPVFAWLVRQLAGAEVRVARALLAPGNHRQLVERAARLAESRARVVDAQAAELRRIERDLHDGAQAGIVAAGMTLALADRKLRNRGEVVPELGLVRRQLDDALGELRRLVRGIHPPILTDRGLYEALAAIAADSPLMVEVRGDPTDRYPPAIESAAYFVVAEGLANAGKHADATSCLIVLARVPGFVTVTLTDDGQGGADPTGSGLAGLRQRVEALDGTLTLTSPAGGPTRLRAEFPCVS